jgi:hypothetical protein
LCFNVIEAVNIAILLDMINMITFIALMNSDNDTIIKRLACNIERAFNVRTTLFSFNIIRVIKVQKYLYSYNRILPLNVIYVQ